MNKIIQGNCLEVMKTMDENSVDSIVCDPPYELGFMGKSWDSTGIANNKEMWAEALRVLKPGGHLLSFGGTRTYHRMACAIEDAGFEVRDMVSWIYGSGFPKSLNIGKAVDKLQGNEREPYERPDFVARSNKTEQRKSQVICGEKGRYTKGTSEWEGWGTALKPACEPCVLARKPLSEKTVALNVLKWGTGGINIDGSRVESNEDMSDIKAFGSMPENKVDGKGFSRPWMEDKQNILDKQNVAIDKMKSLGRFPANIIHDGSDEVLEVFPNTKSVKGKNVKRKDCANIAMSGRNYARFNEEEGYSDSGSASRFFYCAKTSKNERNKGCEGLEEKAKVFNGQSGEPSEDMKGVEQKFTTLPAKNNHPTVKPQALMKYLITLITPKGGTVLDPFAGSGSTLVAAKDLGFDYIGIELTPEYIPIIEARLNSVQTKLL